MKRLQLKVCGMREADNIAQVAALAPDYIGFVFVAGSPRDATAVVKRESLASIPDGVTTVGVFRDAALEFVCQKVNELGLKAVQLHGSEDERYIERLRGAISGVTVVRAVGVRSGADLTEVKDLPGLVDLFLLDSGSGGSGVPFDWSCLSEYRASTPFLLAGGIRSENRERAVAAAQSVSGCVGLDLNSGLESSPGVKDINLVRSFCEGIRV